MKKTYITPKTEAVVINGPRLMLSVSDTNAVNNFSHDGEDDIVIGDE